MIVTGSHMKHCSDVSENELKEIPTEIGLIAGLLTLGGTPTSLVKKERGRERRL